METIERDKVLVNMLLSVDNTLKKEGVEISFTQMVKKIPELQDHLNQLYYAGFDENRLKNILKNNKENTVPSIVHDYSELILNKVLEHEGKRTFDSEIKTIKINIENDQNLSDFLKKALLDAIQISISSNELWHKNDTNYLAKRLTLLEPDTSIPEETPLLFGRRFVHIGGADTAAALLMIQSGAAGTAAVLTGGWGGLAVLVGGAAVGSLLAANLEAVPREPLDIFKKELIENVLIPQK